MHQLTLKCFGVGDGWPCADRNHSAYLYRFAHASVLIDCGEPLSRLYKASGMSYDVVDRIFLSHLHFDHIGGFFMLMQGFWLEQRQKDLVVHVPQDGLKPIRSLMKAACIFDELLPFPLQFETLKPAEAVMVQDVRVTPFPNTHLAGLRKAFHRRYPQAYEAFSFLLEVGDFRVGHSADIGAATDLEPLFQKPLDLLVCELAHVTPEDLFAFLKDRAVKHILFTHLSNRLWTHLEEIKKLAAERLPHTHFTFAQDDQEFVI